MTARVGLTLETIQQAIDAGQEITAEQSSTRVVLYRESIILTHRFYTIVLCADCGHGKAAFVTDGPEPNQYQANQLLARFKALPICQCHQIPKIPMNGGVLSPESLKGARI